MNESDNKVLMDLGETIEEVRFRRYPSKAPVTVGSQPRWETPKQFIYWLELLTEGNSGIKFDLSACGNLGSFDEFRTVGSHITKAGFETDNFLDAVDLYDFSNLIELGLYFPKPITPDAGDLERFQIAVANLEFLELLVLYPDMHIEPDLLNTIDTLFSNDHYRTEIKWLRGIKKRNVILKKKVSEKN